MGINFSGVNRSWFGRALRLPLALLPKGMTVPVLQGPLRGTRWIVGASVHGCWLGSYEYDKQRLFQGLVREGSVVYDIGANVGFYSLLASKFAGQSGRVYAFEPEPRNCRFLRRHIELNGISNVSVMEMAVSTITGEAFFDLDSGPHHAMGHLSDGGALKVRTIAIDDCVFKQGMPAPQVMKIDVEGAEAEVLKGSFQTLRSQPPIILLATHGATVHQECLRILAGHEFVVESLDASPVETSGELIVRPRRSMNMNNAEAPVGPTVSPAGTGSLP